MSPNFEFVKVLIMLTPGFFVYKIIKYLTTREEESNIHMFFEIVIYSTVCGLLGYAVTPVIEKLFCITLIEGSLFDIMMRLTPISIVFSFFLGVVVSLIVNSRILFWLAWKLNLTESTGYSSIWDDLLMNKDNYIMVTLSCGDTYAGLVSHFNPSTKKPMIFLDQCYRIEENEGKLEMFDANIDGLFIVDINSISHIQFLKKQEEE